MLREIWPFADAHHRAGRPVVLARLVGRDGPGSRPLGATMAVAGDGTWRGSLSGGCVEGIVLEKAREVLAGAAPHVTTVSPGEHLLPWEEAPACAGDLRVLVVAAPPEPVHSAITTALTEDRPLAVRVQLRPPYTWSVAATVSRLPDDGPAHTEELGQRPRLLLVGATDLAAVLAALAAPLHRRTVVLDPRPAHVASGAFPAPVTAVRTWPDEWITRHPLDAHDAVVALSHDPRIDDRALRAALTGPAGYVAALGSRTTHAQRLRRLAGTPGLDRLHGPAGLDLGGTSLAESALSILAELIAAGNGRSGRPLRDGDLPIRATALSYGGA
ncbi:XdhC family protein [Streptomyces xinghaiensis]|uniref:XdhC family protein n=1 Tax=Streptomyces xinghaiensis TaxID=1038928 RepID=UPI002E11B1D3|nr:XdhC family protein [Streptomyces xinghaiensis]